MMTLRVAIELGRFPHEVEELPFSVIAEIFAFWEIEAEETERQRKENERKNKAGRPSQVGAGSKRRAMRRRHIG